MPFCFAERNVLFSSSQEQAIVHRTIAFNCSSHASVVTAEKQNPIRKDGVFVAMPYHPLYNKEKSNRRTFYAAN